MASTEASEGATGAAAMWASVDERRDIASLDLRQDPPVVEYAPDGTVGAVEDRSSRRARTADRSVDDNRWSVLAALAVLNVLDVASTAAVLAGGGTENNPLMRPLIESVWPAVLVKGAALGLVGWLLTRCTNSRRVEILMACATGWYLAVVSWNVTVLAFA